jgi:hypothetical protein
MVETWAIGEWEQSTLIETPNLNDLHFLNYTMDNKT